jgi:copper(I)-binding protein
MLKYAAALLLAAGLIAVAWLAASDGDQPAGTVTIAAPWARATPGGATTAAVYLTLGVAGPVGDRLVAVASPRAARAELHRSTEEAGIQRMSGVSSIELAAGRTTALAPGGLHVMLVGLTAPLAVGDVLPLTLTFARAGALAIQVQVLEPTATGPDDRARPEDAHAGH